MSRCRLVSSSTLGEFILYDKEMKSPTSRDDDNDSSHILSSYCDRIDLSCSHSSLNILEQLSHQRDLQFKGNVIRLLKQVVLFDLHSNQHASLMGK